MTGLSLKIHPLCNTSDTDSSSSISSANPFFPAGVMKPTCHFREQLAKVTLWFDQWNTCEQTVALFSLIQKISPIHARFLTVLLDRNIAECMELQLQEQEANDPGYINSLSTESKETAVNQLLSHLPLLTPRNDEAKAQYIALIPKILAHSIRHNVHIEESRQLLSYSLIHPALNVEDRCILTQWMRQLEDSIKHCPIPVSPYISGPLPPTSPSTENFSGCQYNIPRLDLWRPGTLVGMGPSVEVGSYSVLNNLGSNSLPPGIGSQHMALHSMNSAPAGSISSHPDGTQTLPMPHSRIKRSTSLTPPIPHNGLPSGMEQQNFDLDHAPLSPQSSVTSSGSDTLKDENNQDVFHQDGTGMKDVPCWLKGLRLHKYSYIFKNMTYEEMMSITEEKLEKMNITKGARHKIVLSIQKLRERQPNLISLEKDLEEGEGTIRFTLNEVKNMIQTPIKAFHSSCVNGDSIYNNGESGSSCSDPPSAPPSPPIMDEEGQQHIAENDLPGQLTHLLGKICATLLISTNQDENLNFFVMVVDKCLSHEAFTPIQKRRLFAWKQQIQKACNPLPPRRSLENKQRNKWNTYQNGGGQVESGESASSLRRKMPVQLQQVLRLPLSRQNGQYSSQRSAPLSAAVIKRPSLQEHMKPHVQIQRTNSAPVRPNPLPLSMFGKNAEGIDSNDPELNIRLESLCLSVTEHALGSFDGAVPLF